MLLNAAKCQSYSFYRFWVTKGKSIQKQSFLFPAMSSNGLNCVGQLNDNNGEVKDWETIKLELNLKNKFYFLGCNWCYTSILEKKYFRWQR